MHFMNGIVVSTGYLMHFMNGINVNVVVYGPDIRDYAYSTNVTFPLARCELMQPAAIDPALDLCSRYPLRAGWTETVRDTKLGQHFYR